MILGKIQTPGLYWKKHSGREPAVMLQQALEIEIEEYLEKHASLTDENGRRLVVKNGYHPAREIVTGLGPITVKAPRADDRKLDPERKRPFTSSILPRYMRKIPSIDNLVPVLYLKGLSTNGFQDAPGIHTGGRSSRFISRQYRAAEKKLGG